jgi:hydrophobe/amphiphile efflux-3 (HAE3) family protein
MDIRERLERLAGAAARRPLLTLSIVVVLAVAGGLLSLGLSTDTGDSAFVSSSSSSYRATLSDQQHFGGDPVVVLIRERLTDLVETRDLGTVSELEACLAGQQIKANQTLGSFAPLPANQARPYGGAHSPCGGLMRTHDVEVVYGPGTFLNRAVAAVSTAEQTMLTEAGLAVRRAAQEACQLALARHLGEKQCQTAAQAAAQIEYAKQLGQIEQLYLNSGIKGTPRIDDPQFIPQIVFDPIRGVGQPKARFAYLFPTWDSALIQARLRPNLTSEQRAQAISWIRQAIRMPMFQLGYGGTYTVSGVPVVINDLNNVITGSIAVLIIAALVVMAVALLLVFRSRLRLLPLGIALAAVGITFGATELVGGSLTMASIAVLPILIGLAVDYAVQLQSRMQEALGDTTAGAPRRVWSGQTIARAVGSGAPAIATAAAATAVGFLVLLLSPVPMVQGFGILLVVGIGVALACALTVGPAAMALASRYVAGQARPRLGDRGGRIAAAVTIRGGRAAGTVWASILGAAEIVSDAARATLSPLLRATRTPRPAWPRGVSGRLGQAAPAVGALAGATRGTLRAVVRQPGRVLAVGLFLAALGWVADTQTAVQSDVTKLVPSNMPALRDLHTLERVTGVSGEIDVVVSGHDVATPATIGWMVRYEDSLLAHFGYLETKGCSSATLCPALSLPDLFCSGPQTGQGQCPTLSQTSIEGLLGAVPSYFKRAVITPDQREASLAFGIRLMPLSRQQQVIAYMRSQLHPPPGVSAQLAGIPVLAAQANADLSSPVRRLLTLVVGLIAVGLVLLVIFRQAERALVPLIPIALATGWSALIVYLIGIPLNPLSAALGALVIAVSTEFSVLLSERFRQERAGGRDLQAALARTYRSTGRAVMASGITAIAGFGVLMFSTINMLRDFGLVTLIDLSVSLAGVLLVLPAVLALSERGQLAGSVRNFASRSRAYMPRWRRPAGGMSGPGR